MRFVIRKKNKENCVNVSVISVGSWEWKVSLDTPNNSNIFTISTKQVQEIDFFELTRPLYVRNAL